MFAVSVDGFALLRILVEDVVLLKSLELLQEASSFSHLLADVHGVLESLVPGKLRMWKVSNKRKKAPDRNIKGTALGAEDVGFLQVDLSDEAASDVPFGIYIHNIS